VGARPSGITGYGHRRAWSTWMPRRRRGGSGAVRLHRHSGSGRIAPQRMVRGPRDTGSGRGGYAGRRCRPYRCDWSLPAVGSGRLRGVGAAVRARLRGRSGAVADCVPRSEPGSGAGLFFTGLLRRSRTSAPAVATSSPAGSGAGPCCSGLVRSGSPGPHTADANVRPASTRFQVSVVATEPPGVAANRRCDQRSPRARAYRRRGRAAGAARPGNSRRAGSSGTGILDASTRAAASRSVTLTLRCRCQCRCSVLVPVGRSAVGLADCSPGLSTDATAACSSRRRRFQLDGRRRSNLADPNRDPWVSPTAVRRRPRYRRPGANRIASSRGRPRSRPS